MSKDKSPNPTNTPEEQSKKAQQSPENQAQPQGQNHGGGNAKDGTQDNSAREMQQNQDGDYKGRK